MGNRIRTEISDIKDIRLNRLFSCHKYKRTKEMEENYRNSGGSTGKAIPVQSWKGSEGSRRLRTPDFMTIGTRRW